MIEVTVTGTEAQAARFAGAGDRIRAALVQAMQRQWFRVQAQVVQGKLSGDPLRRRTGFLASSINVGGPNTATAFQDGPAAIVGRIGTKVRYGIVHENGGTFTIPAHDRTVTSVFGRTVAPTVQQVRAHSVTFPKRSFLRSTLDEMSGSIRADIAKAIAASVGEV